MSKEIKLEIYVDGKSISHCNKLNIQQKFNAHHEFELVLDHDALEELGSHKLESSQEYLGKFITVNFGDGNTDENVFKGLITQVGLEQKNGLWGSLVMRGFSPTILLEAGKHYTSYTSNSLQDIFGEVTKGLASNDMFLDNKPKNKTPITYVSQYGESHFQFINRLASEYGEWFFYDGSTLHFGKPDNNDKIDLRYGEHISSMNFSMKLVPSNISHYSYNSKDDNLLTSKLPDSVAGADSYTQKALQVSKELYRNTLKQPVPIRASSKELLDKYAEGHKGKLAASTVQLSGASDSPKLKPGAVIHVSVSKVGYQQKGDEDHGEYLVTNVSHCITGTGTYTNTFEAIPSSNQFIPFETDAPVAETQIGTVVQNNDPDGLGRIKVQLLWQKEKGLSTDWLRVLTPDAGGSDKVGKNRGLVLIPEVGDQVMVGFRYNDPNRPFVMGSLFHGKNAGGGGAGNKSKSLTTRNGSIIALDESQSNITISDPSGNVITLDGANNITITSKTSIVLDSETIVLKGKNIGLQATDNLIGSGKVVGITATTDLTAGGNKVFIGGTAQLNMSSKELNVDGSKTSVSGKTVNLSGTGDVGISGAIVKINS